MVWNFRTSAVIMTLTHVFLQLDSQNYAMPSAAALAAATRWRAAESVGLATNHRTAWATTGWLLDLLVLAPRPLALDSSWSTLSSGCPITCLLPLAWLFPRLQQLQRWPNLTASSLQALGTLAHNRDKWQLPPSLVTSQGPWILICWPAWAMSASAKECLLLSWVHDWNCKPS